MPYTITRVAELRAAFWREHEDLAPLRRPGRTHNEYPATVRVAFVDYVDHLARHGAISERLAASATLGD